MSLAFWCVFFAAFLPLAFTWAAKMDRNFNNANPREYLEKTIGWRKRAHWVQLNGFESFPQFASAVVIATIQHVPRSRVDALAVTFVILRIIYGLLYLADRPTLRSVCWSAATICVVALFIYSALA